MQTRYLPRQLLHALCTLLLMLATLPGAVAAAPTANLPARAAPQRQPETAAGAHAHAISRSYPSGPLAPPEAGYGPGSVDNSTATTTFTVSSSDFAPGAVVTKATIDIAFAKVGDGACPGPGGGDDWAEEIRFRLLAPDSTVVTLVDFNDYLYSNPDVGPVTVTFDDDAASTVAGLPIQDGVFRPSIGALADFVGLDPAANGGVWTLELSDLDPTDPLCFGSATLYITAGLLPDLSVEKTGSPDPVNAGEYLYYTVTARSVAGDVVASGVRVTDTLPLQVDYVTDTGGCAFGAGTGPGGADQLFCPLPDIAPGSSRSFQVQVRVPADAVTNTLDGTLVLTNSVEVSAETVDPEPLNNQVVANTFVRDLADLRVVKLSLPNTTVRAGEVFTYTILVDNLGPSHARGVALQDDILSTGAFTLLRIIEDPGRDDSCVATPTSNGTMVACELNAPLEPQVGLPGNGRWTVGLEVQANEAQGVSNLVQVYTQPNGTPDPNWSNNQAQSFTSVTAVADLEVVKTAVGQVQVDGQPGGVFAPTADRVTAGGALTYTLTITNHGPSTAENVVARDFLPPAVAVRAAVPAQGICNQGAPGDPAGSLRCHLGSLAPAQATTVIVVATAPSSLPGGTNLYNEALVSSDTFDPDNVNDLAVHWTAVDAWADLGVDKAAHPAPALLGQVITYVVAVRNGGPSDAVGAAVLDPVPAGLTGAVWECAAAGGASCTTGGAGSIDEQVGLPAGGALTYTLRSTVAAAVSITNTATVTVPVGVGDPNSDNNVASVSNAPHALFLPLVARAFVSSGPDLVVSGIAVAANSAQVTIRNQGSAPVTQGFWVDLYINPQPAPTAVNQVWADLAAQGIAWGVARSGAAAGAGRDARSHRRRPLLRAGFQPRLLAHPGGHADLRSGRLLRAGHGVWHRAGDARDDRGGLQ